MNDPGPIADLRLRQEMAEHMMIVRGYTHSILIGERGVGTGVAFRLGQRLFLITASHNLTNNFRVGLFMREGPVSYAEVLSYHFHPDSSRTDIHSDFGFIEIKNIPAMAACDIEQFHIGPAVPQIQTNALCFIAGCPESGFLAPPRSSEIGLAVIAGYLCGGSSTTLEIEYAESGHAVSPDGSTFQRTDFYETPRGFSGGGVWVLLKTAVGEVFQPRKHIKMCGTDFQWDQRRRILQAMRPRISIPYFFECYPDLRNSYGHCLKALESP